MAKHYICSIRSGNAVRQMLVEAYGEEHAKQRLREMKLEVVRIEPAADELVRQLRPALPPSKIVSSEPVAKPGAVRIPKEAKRIRSKRRETGIADLMKFGQAVERQEPSADAWEDTLEFVRRETEQFQQSVPVHPTSQSTPESPALIPTSSLRAEIGSLVGMASIKHELAMMEALIQVNRQRRLAGLQAPRPSMHFVFRGRPGTGKTTVARILGRLLCSYGFLERPDVIEVDRADLVGQYLGQTAPKVDEVVRHALGGTLFIDEAYALARANTGYADAFGLEAIDALLKRMEDFRNRMVVIIAGYPEEMNHFLESNPGMKSRFTKYIDFPDYVPDELLQIFTKMAEENGYRVASGAMPIVSESVDVMYKSRTRSFGNARDVRNLVDRAIQTHALRISQLGRDATAEELSLLTGADVANAF